MDTPVSTTVIIQLITEADWISLHELIDPRTRDRAVANLLEQLKNAGVRSAIVENDYLDRDYSEEFKAFYSTLFRRYRRHTKRCHFFLSDLSDAFVNKSAAEISGRLQSESKEQKYVGFIVIRPIPDAPVGRVVLRVLRSPQNIYAAIEVRAVYEVHLLGAALEVQGVPFIEQDAKITACAQASIWMAGRHFHQRHRGPWFSTVQIAEAASKPTDVVLASSLPAGAGGLGLTNMVRALRAMERHPYAYTAERDAAGKVTWPEYLNPESILCRYVQSGIPVILGLIPWEHDQTDGHAIVVVGSTFRERPNLTFRSDHPNISNYVPYFLIHDDQRGINLRMPVVTGEVEGETPYNVRDHVFFILIPLPDKVFVTAETAERKAWDVLNDFYVHQWGDLKSNLAKLIGASIPLGDQVAVALQQQSVVARTYLRISGNYKRQIVEGSISDDVKQKIILHDLPRMVWVTEFGLAKELNRLDPANRRIFGHCVYDATASGDHNPPLIVHVPGFLWQWSQMAPEFYPRSERLVYPILDDHQYEPKYRV